MGLAASAGVLLALLTVGGASGAPASTIIATFDTHGTYTWTVPTGVGKVIIDVYGAAGGNVSDGSTLIARGGLGGAGRPRGGRQKMDVLAEVEAAPGCLTS
jgi:hypothetical protein